MKGGLLGLVVVVIALIVGTEAKLDLHPVFIDALNSIPEQVHIGYYDKPSQMTVSWSTAMLSSSVVHYGTSPLKLTSTATGTCSRFTYGNENGKQFVHKVLLEGLVPGTRYYYSVESSGQKSPTFSFVTMQEGNNWIPKFLVYGDMGRHGGAQALPSLVNSVKSGYPTGIIHVGDFAYDLSTDGGVNGDEFMNRIQPLATSVPYMTCIGNHETDHNATHYRYRFFMPGDTENMWFSWGAGPVHFVAYSTEVYDSNPHPVYTPERQFKWLQEEFDRANANRKNRPWLVAYGHRPMYCSNSDGDDCTHRRSVVRHALEELFHRAGVDVIIEAHEHSYERLWPTFNETVYAQNYIEPKAAVHIISGAAGCNEGDGVCVNPIPGPRGPWSAFRSSGNTTYGYARMEFHNATHVYWDQIHATENDKTLDSIWIVQHNHGPRD